MMNVVMTPEEWTATDFLWQVSEKHLDDIIGYQNSDNICILEANLYLFSTCFIWMNANVHNSILGSVI